MARANQALVMIGMRQAEAPFRQSGGFTIRPDIARSSLQHHRDEEKALRRPRALEIPLTRKLA